MTDFKTSDRDVNRAIRSWLREDRHEDASRIAGAVLNQAETTPRRRATWWPARRFPDMNNVMKFGLAAAAVVAVLIVGSQLFGSAGGLGAGPTPTPEPTATPEPSMAGPSPHRRRISKGRSSWAWDADHSDHRGPWLVRDR